MVIIPMIMDVINHQNFYQMPASWEGGNPTPMVYPTTPKVPQKNRCMEIGTYSDL